MGNDDVEEKMSGDMVRGSVGAIEIRSVDEAKALAQIAVASNLVQAKKPEEAVVLLLTGKELGLSPMQSLRGIYVVSGRPVLSADLMVAVVRRSGLCDSWRTVKSTTEECTIETRRKGEESAATRTWTMADAKRAGITSKQTWAQYPAQMLRHRCAADLAREVYPDVLMGLYDPDELGAEVVDAEPVAGPAPRVEREPIAIRGIESPHPIVNGGEQQRVREIEGSDPSLGERNAAVAEVVAARGNNRPTEPAPANDASDGTFEGDCTTIRLLADVPRVWLKHREALSAKGDDAINDAYNELVAAAGRALRSKNARAIVDRAIEEADCASQSLHELRLCTTADDLRAWCGAHTAKDIDSLGLATAVGEQAKKINATLSERDRIKPSTITSWLKKPTPPDGTSGAKKGTGSPGTAQGGGESSETPAEASSARLTVLSTPPTWAGSRASITAHVAGLTHPSHVENSLRLHGKSLAGRGLRLYVDLCAERLRALGFGDGRGGVLSADEARVFAETWALEGKRLSTAKARVADRVRRAA